MRLFKMRDSKCPKRLLGKYCYSTQRSLFPSDEKERREIDGYAMGRGGDYGTVQVIGGELGARARYDE
jgi:hypothetical protein